MPKKPPASDLISRERPPQEDSAQKAPLRFRSILDAKGDAARTTAAQQEFIRTYGSARERAFRNVMAQQGAQPLTPHRPIHDDVPADKRRYESPWYMLDWPEQAAAEERTEKAMDEYKEARRADEQRKWDKRAVHQAHVLANRRPLNVAETDYIPREEYERTVDALAGEFVDLKKKPKSPATTEAIKKVRRQLADLNVYKEQLAWLGVPTEYLTVEGRTGDGGYYNRVIREIPGALKRGQRGYASRAASDNDWPKSKALKAAEHTLGPATPEYVALELDRDRARRDLLSARIPIALRSQRPYLEQAIDLLDTRIRENEDFLASQESPVD